MPASGIEQDRLIGTALSGGRYRIQSHLGSGSMAFVYKAYDARLETEVVVKVPTPEKLADDEFRIRFRTESQLLVRLSHPHVVKILDVGDCDGVPFVVMQYLAGGTLKDRIAAALSNASASGEPGAASVGVSVDSLKGWVREVDGALDFVNAQSIIHRDVKPANILFDQHGNAYLSDCGLTKIMYGDHRDYNSEMTGAGYVVGTPNYVALFGQSVFCEYLIHLTTIPFDEPFTKLVSSELRCAHVGKRPSGATIFSPSGSSNGV
ncbi:MAG: serine/threonine protein kinase, partial [Planctomycetaceae bacterium]|nr:serine/threonine protein kinase [Planctomycetaceae bacterium]